MGSTTRGAMADTSILNLFVEAGEDVGNKLLVINKSLARICHLICEPLHFALVAGRRHVPFLRCGEGHA